MKLINLETLKYIEITDKQAATIEHLEDIDRDIDGDLCCSDNAYNQALKLI